MLKRFAGFFQVGAFVVALAALGISSYAIWSGNHYRAGNLKEETSSLGLNFDTARLFDKDNGFQYVQVNDNLFRRLEVVAGEIEHYSGMNHGPDRFVVLNERQSDMDTVKDVGERFSLTAEPVDGGYQVKFYIPESKDGQAYMEDIIGEYRVASSVTRTEDLIHFLPVENAKSYEKGDIWLKIGDQIFFFEKATKTVKEIIR